MIEPIGSTDLLNRIAGEYAGVPFSFSGVSADSRHVRKGDLFVALPGEKVDGHDFVVGALERGACAALVTRFVQQAPLERQIRVDDCLQGIAVIGGINRERFGGRVIGITGSSGKTSTKRMLATVLSQIAPTLATQGNQNNELGVPLTLLNIGLEHRFAIVEMGARALGDIAYLGRFVQPDVAILLNAGMAHIEVFGSHENTVRAKGEIYGALRSEGVAIVNMDQSAARTWLEMADGHRIMTYSARTASAAAVTADVYASKLRLEPAFSSFELCTANETVAVTLPLPGVHNVENSLAVAAAALALGLSLAQIATGLARCDTEPGRLQRKVTPGGAVLLDDSYNANPASMQAALSVLALQAGPKVAVLGQMGELGCHAEQAHLNLADQLAACDLSAVYLVGAWADAMAERLPGRARVYPTNLALAQDLCARLNGDEHVLIKGSRFTAMDQVVQYLMENHH